MTGLCECGCGRETEPAPYTDPRREWSKGEPKPYWGKHRLSRRRLTYTVDPETGCWVWPSTFPNGYGQMSYLGRPGSGLAHRMHYEELVGPIPEGLQLDHLCRNRACCNPDHLEPVTCSENLRRGAGTKLTAEQVAEIRAMPRTWGGNVAMAERYGVSRYTISSIRSKHDGRRKWADVKAAA